jgi:hypothetical protein
MLLPGVFVPSSGTLSGVQYWNGTGTGARYAAAGKISPSIISSHYLMEEIRVQSISRYSATPVISINTGGKGREQRRNGSE